MVQKAVNNYYKFFDETLSSSTFIVLIITVLIFMVGMIIPNAHAYSDYMKGNIMETQAMNTQKNTVIIDGVEYKLQFIKVQ